VSNREPWVKDSEKMRLLARGIEEVTKDE
jgi:hypothetical protein